MEPLQTIFEYSFGKCVELVRLEKKQLQTFTDFMSKNVGFIAKIPFQLRAGPEVPDPHNWNMQRTMGFSIILLVLCDHEPQNLYSRKHIIGNLNLLQKKYFQSRCPNVMINGKTRQQP
jgi:hypothetical protein